MACLRYPSRSSSRNQRRSCEPRRSALAATQPRIRMLRLCKAGQITSLRASTELLGFSLRQRYRWWAAYRHGGLARLLESHPQPGKPAKLTRGLGGARSRAAGRADRHPLGCPALAAGAVGHPLTSTEAGHRRPRSTAPENERLAQEAGVAHLVIPRFGPVSAVDSLAGSSSVRFSSSRRRPWRPWSNEPQLPPPERVRSPAPRDAPEQRGRCGRLSVAESPASDSGVEMVQPPQFGDARPGEFPCPLGARLLGDAEFAVALDTGAPPSACRSAATICCSAHVDARILGAPFKEISVHTNASCG